MQTSARPLNGLFDRHMVRVRPEPEGKFTAQAVGLPEIAATGSSREEALAQVRALLRAWLDSGQLALVEVAHDVSVWPGFGHADSQDPVEQEYLADLARARQEDLERTLQENDRECSNTSSTPTT